MKSRGVSTTELAKELGISTDTIYRLRDSGAIANKNCWVINPTSRRKTYRWNLIGCRKDYEKACASSK